MLVLGLLCLGFDCFSTNHGCSISGLNSLLAGSAPKSLVCSAMAPKNQGKEPAAPKTASNGESMDPNAVSRMLGLLKYISDPDKNKKGQDMEEARIGLEVYSNLASNEKKKFSQSDNVRELPETAEQIKRNIIHSPTMSRNLQKPPQTSEPMKRNIIYSPTMSRNLQKLQNQ